MLLVLCPPLTFQFLIETHIFFYHSVVGETLTLVTRFNLEFEDLPYLFPVVCWVLPWIAIFSASSLDCSFFVTERISICKQLFSWTASLRFCAKMQKCKILSFGFIKTKSRSLDSSIIVLFRSLLLFLLSSHVFNVILWVLSHKTDNWTMKKEGHGKIMNVQINMNLKNSTLWSYESKLYSRFFPSPFAIAWNLVAGYPNKLASL